MDNRIINVHTDNNAWNYTWGCTLYQESYIPTQMLMSNQEMHLTSHKRAHDHCLSARSVEKNCMQHDGVAIYFSWSLINALVMKAIK